MSLTQFIIVLDGIPSEEAHGIGEINPPQNIPSVIPIFTDEEFGLPHFSVGPVNIEQNSITTEESFGTPNVGKVLFVNFGDNRIGIGHYFSPDIPSGPTDYSPITTEESFGSFHLSQIISPLGIESGEDLNQGIAPNTILSKEAFGNFQINQNMVLDGIPSEELFYFVSIGNITVNSGISTQEKVGIPNVALITHVPLTSILIESQLPDFIVDEHPKFVDFVEAYYEYLESRDNSADYKIHTLYENQDIDTTLDQFESFFYDEFLSNIPLNVIADKRQLLKNIRDYYRARGSEKSFKLFFRILFGEEATFYFPREDILRSSDGKWIQNQTLRVTSTTFGDELFDLRGQVIRGKNNNSSAFVEKVLKVQEGTITLYELFLNRASITGVFEAEEEIKNEANTLTATISPIPIKINIINEGSGYNVGDEILFSGTGTGAKATITVVGTQGEIKATEMKEFGAGYFGTTTIDFPATTGVQATGTVTIGGLTEYPGFFLNNDGFLSSNKYLHDGYYYQQFSYVTILGQALASYREELKKQLHPAGYIFFGQVRSQNLVDGGISISENQKCSLVNRCLELVPQKGGIRSLQTSYILCESTRDSEEGARFGPTYSSIFRDRFRYNPRERFDANSLLSVPNENYWSTYANYQIKDFKDLIPKDIENMPGVKINIMPEPGFKSGYSILSGETFGHLTLIP